MKHRKESYKKYEYSKDQFMKGEYSIYKRKYNGQELTMEEYCFGTKRKADAIRACEYLNRLNTYGGN